MVKVIHIYKLIVLGIIIGIGTHLSNNEVLAKHADIGSALYEYERYVEEERFERAEKTLLEHEQDIYNLFTNHVPELRNELLQIVDTNIALVNDASVDKHVKMKHTYTLVLAVDAINNPNNPVWLKWKTNMEDLLKASVDSTPITTDQLNQIITQWEIMRPSLAIALNDKQFHMIAEPFDKLKENQNKLNEIEMDNQIKEAFREVEILDVSNTANKKESISFLWVIAVVGGFITITLSYVAWKKYIGEKNKKQRQTIN